MRKIYWYALKIFLNILKIIFYKFFKINEKLMLFGTAFGGFCDNTKYLYLYINKNTNYKAVWISKNRKLIEKLKYNGFNAEYLYSIRAFLLMLKAKYFFVTHDTDDIYPAVRKETIVINLWHGSPIKKMGYDSPIDIKEILRRKKLGSKVYNRWNYFIIAHNSFFSVFQSAFRIGKKSLQATGLPRNDILFQARDNKNISNDIRSKILKRHNVKKGKKLILYAPTFRDKLNNSATHVIKKLIREFKKYKNDDIVLFLRLHPLDRLNLPINLFNNGNFKDISDYEDMQELLISCDLLITDYSSIIFDYSILKRPIILFPYDIESYKKERGGFYFNYNRDFPYTKVDNVNDLVEVLKNVFSEPQMLTNQKVNEFYRKYNLEGNASSRILKALKLN